MKPAGRKELISKQKSVFHMGVGYPLALSFVILPEVENLAVTAARLMVAVQMLIRYNKV